MELGRAHVHEGEAALDLTPGTTGLLLGDRNYWLPKLKTLLRQAGMLLLTPFRTAKHAPPGSWSPVLGRIRYRIDTVFGQLVDRCQAKRVWARDRWHWCNRLLRMVRIAYLSGPVQSGTWSAAASVGAAGGLNNLHIGLARCLLQRCDER
jgi:hypothetical protein